MKVQEMVEKCDRLNSERIHLNEMIFKAINAFLVAQYGEMVDENTPASEDAIGKIFAPEVSWSPNRAAGGIDITCDIVADRWIDHFNEKEIFVSYDVLDKYYEKEY